MCLKNLEFPNILNTFSYDKKNLQFLKRSTPPSENLRYKSFYWLPFPFIMPCYIIMLNIWIFSTNTNMGDVKMSNRG